MTLKKLELCCMETKVKKTSILLIVSTLVVVGSGALLGLILGRKFFAQDLSNWNVEVDEKDDELYEKFIKLNNSKVNSAKYLSEFRPYQLVKIGLMNFDKASNAQITTTGTVNASIANQTINSKYIKTNNSYFSESLSSGLMKIGWRFYQTDDEIKVYKSSKLKNTESAEWISEVKETYNSDTFKETWGKSMKIPFIYTLNYLTIDKESSKIENENIIVNLSLKPDLSTINYGKQMKKTSDLSDVPTFSLVNLKLTLSSNLTILKNDIYEEYGVPYGFTVQTKGTITENYTYLENISIPSLSEDVEYK